MRTLWPALLLTSALLGCSSPDAATEGDATPEAEESLSPESSAVDSAAPPPAAVQDSKPDKPVGDSDQPSGETLEQAGQTSHDELRRLVPEPAEQSPLVVKGDVVPPERLSGTWAPLSQAECRWSGLVLLQTVIDAEGRLGELTFLKETPPECLQDHLRETLATWRFKPAELHGSPVPVYYNLTVNIHPR